MPGFVEMSADGALGFKGLCVHAVGDEGNTLGQGRRSDGRLEEVV
jgi:hypothetical protein